MQEKYHIKHHETMKSQTANVDFCGKYTIRDFSTLYGKCLKSFPQLVENFVEISILQGKSGKNLLKTWCLRNYNKKLGIYGCRKRRKWQKRLDKKICIKLVPRTPTGSVRGTRGRMPPMVLYAKKPKVIRGEGK